MFNNDTGAVLACTSPGIKWSNLYCMENKSALISILGF